MDANVSLGWTSSSRVPEFPGNVSLEWTPSGAVTEAGTSAGPQRDPLWWVVPITVIYILILISGCVGNACTCLVVVRNRTMRTATNYYLFSLAVSDLLLLVVSLPQELYLHWYPSPYVFGETFCILRGFTAETTTNASILTILCFTTERYLAICHPLKAHTMSKLSRAVKCIVLVWVVGGACAVPLTVQFGLRDDTDRYGRVVPDRARCQVKHPLPHSFLISTCLFFLLPMAAISVLYALIGIRLRESERMAGAPRDAAAAAPRAPVRRSHLRRFLNRQSTTSLNGRINSRKAVIKMLFAVVVAFFVCWAPFHAQRLMATYTSETQQQTGIISTTYKTLDYISGVTYFVSATINPILYSIMSRKFRRAFRDTLARCCGRRGYELASSSAFARRSRLNSSHSRPTANGTV